MIRRAGPSGRGRYHHGDLRAALVDTAIELLAEKGPESFSLAEASRRLGVAASAPYRHFADREALLVAVAVRAAQRLAEHLAGIDGDAGPQDRLCAAVRAFVRFADTERPLFRALTTSGLDKTRHPEIAAAAAPIITAFAGPATELAGAQGETLAAVVAATAQGHALLLLDGAFGTGESARESAAEQAAAATRALVAGRAELGPDAGQAPAPRR
ncbi:TetR/AcrR family transcriptional regulator [Nocardia aurantia]|uniref:HTH tetR-type domain-containing protein n=1 Tax=Nocardia aurantia TaxID=2585199 RepID=A0A7K0DZE1_9NOCA|nr:TetR/AcrR family transcriptional regulator [Nocardia aurantia]MQY30897.1 hypothetical protein [Nocardia aurantia]